MSYYGKWCVTGNGTFDVFPIKIDVLTQNSWTCTTSCFTLFLICELVVELIFSFNDTVPPVSLLFFSLVGCQ